MKRTMQEMIHTDIKTIAGNIRTQLKKEFPKCTFSVKIQRYSMGQSLHISLMTGPFEAFAKRVHANGYPMPKDHAQLNQYQLREEPQEYMCNGSYLTPEAWFAMKRADEIANEWNYDHSDPQTDYFSVNFYVHLNIGRWDKPFERTA